VPIAVLTFQFDPSTQLFGDLVVRWGTIALVSAIVAALVLAGVLARAGGLRADDVAFVAIGIVPGAVVGGRLGYFLLHASAYGSAPDALLDASVGGLELGLAVVGGFITGSYVASLLGSPMGRWLHVVMAPTLFVLGVGKLSMVLTGTGQGQPNGGDWATAYLGPGPWGSLLPALPSDPSQAYEGIATLVILTGLTIALMLGAFRRRDGKVFFLGIGLWAVARAVVSTTWRDPTVAGGLNAGGLIALGIASACVVALVLLSVRGRMVDDDPDPDVTTDPVTPADPVAAGAAATGEDAPKARPIAWPDSATRRRL
jgi:prolipoprotein diacylglyceryltransferase